MLPHRKAVQPSVVCRQPEVQLVLCDAEESNHRHPGGRDGMAAVSGKPSILTSLGNLLPAEFFVNHIPLHVRLGTELVKLYQTEKRYMVLLSLTSLDE